MKSDLLWARQPCTEVRDDSKMHAGSKEWERFENGDREKGAFLFETSARRRRESFVALKSDIWQNCLWLLSTRLRKSADSQNAH